MKPSPQTHLPNYLISMRRVCEQNVKDQLRVYPYMSLRRKRVMLDTHKQMRSIDMDYRELENRLQRHQDLMREREHDRLVAQVLEEREEGQRKWLIRFKLTFSRMLRREARLAEPALKSSGAVTPRLQQR